MRGGGHRKGLFAYTADMDICKEAQELQSEMAEYRRYLHQNAEVGFALTKTVAFVREKLTEMGYAPQECGKSGLTATVGRGKKCFLLRADMDALPICERSKEKFAARNGNMHACGHDVHTAMLLGAAKLLKKHEKRLKGQVKLFFQPAEELLQGAKSAIEQGVLQSPRPQAAMMLHVLSGVALPTGRLIVATGTSAPAADFFTIEVRGRSCHGSTPWKGVDALTVGARIVLGLEEISAREVSLGDSAVLTVGSMQAGTVGNVISEKCVLKGSLRSFDEEGRERVKRRMEEVGMYVAKAFRAKAKVTYESGCPTLVNDEKLSRFAVEKLRSLLGEDKVFSMADLTGGAPSEGGSEDFAYISQEVPSVMIAIAAGEKSEGFEYPLHHPKVRFDERVLWRGAVTYAHIAMEFLAE